MSRIGKKEIFIPKETIAKIDKSRITIKGPKGELSYKIFPYIQVEQLSNKIILKKTKNQKKTQALHGLLRSIVNNMIIGVSNGFEKKLVINGVGYK